MPFLTFSIANIKFAQKKLTWKSYNAAKALPTTKQVEIIERKEFAKTALDKYIKTFMMYMTFLLIIATYPTRKA